MRQGVAQNHAGDHRSAVAAEGRGQTDLTKALSDAFGVRCRATTLTPQSARPRQGPSSVSQCSVDWRQSFSFRSEIGVQRRTATEPIVLAPNVTISNRGSPFCTTRELERSQPATNCATPAAGLVYVRAQTFPCILRAVRSEEPGGSRRSLSSGKSHPGLSAPMLFERFCLPGPPRQLFWPPIQQ